MVVTGDRGATPDVTPQCGGYNGGLAPLPRVARYTAHGLPRPIMLDPPKMRCISRLVFRILSGKYPEYLPPPQRPSRVPDKQSRYRKRQTEQGLHRIEVLVPSESIDHLKAYARALRDAHRLGARFPSFDGMPSTPDDASRQNRVANPTRPDGKHGAPEPGPSRGKRGVQKKPDFSGGLF